jgi:hypothetical protein
MTLSAQPISSIEVFRAGRHQAADGTTIEFTDADVAAIAASYDPALHEAPIVVGHPRDDAPAYGWVAGLAAEGGRLEATPAQVDPAFAELVREGRFKKISISLYGPRSPANPKQGGWYLRHVGLLGAQPPAVKGLRQASFAASDDGVVTLDLAESWSMGAVARLFRSLREMLIGQFGAEAADRALPASAIDGIAEAPPPMPPEPSQPAPAFAEAGLRPNEETPVPEPTTPDPREAQFAEREAELQAREQRIAEAEAAQRRAADAAFVDGLVTQARLPSGLRDRAVAFLSQLDAVEGVAFAEGAAPATRHAEARALLGALPQLVELREVAPGASRVETDSVQAIEAAADAVIAAEKAKGRDVSFREAVRIVQSRSNQ